MRPLAQLAAAGARRVEAWRSEAVRACHDEDPPPEPARPVPAAPSVPGPCPALPPEVSREALLRLVESVAPRLVLPDKALRALRLIAGTCRWSDFTSPHADPVCFRQQRRLAADLGVSPGHFRKLEARLEAVGLIERRTTENGYRGWLCPGRAGEDGSGSTGPVAGLSLAPLIAGLPRWRALAEAMAAERAALEEARARVRIERRAARRAVEGLGDEHPVRVAYLALRGERFPEPGRYPTAEALAEHAGELRALVEAAQKAVCEAERAGRAAEDERAREGKHGPEPHQEPKPPLLQASERLDHRIGSGAARQTERCHTERTTDPQREICSGAGLGERASEAPGVAQSEGTGQGREQDDTSGGAPGGEAPRGGSGRGRAGEGRGAPEPGPGPEPKPGPEPGLALSRAVRAQLTPAMLRAITSEEMRFYLDHLEPGSGGSGGGGAGAFLRVLEEAARLRRAELGVTAAAWDEAESSLGWLDALVALVVVDANRAHPTAPVRNPGGLLRDLARRHRAGTLDLGASVMALARRREEGAGAATDRT